MNVLGAIWSACLDIWTWVKGGVDWLQSLIGSQGVLRMMAAGLAWVPGFGSIAALGMTAQALWSGLGPMMPAGSGADLAQWGVTAGLEFFNSVLPLSEMVTTLQWGFGWLVSLLSYRRLVELISLIP